MMRYTKEDVTFHCDNPFGGGRTRGSPAVNVKVHSFPSSDEVVEEFHCSEGTAEKALGFTLEMHSECFWEQVADKDELDHYFPGMGVKVYSEGRSGGWLIVEGLPDVETWDAVMLSRWRRFELAMEQEVRYLCSEKEVFEVIKMNEWAVDRKAIEYEVGKCLDLLA